MQQTKGTHLKRRGLHLMLSLLAGFVMILAGCYPGEINSVQEADLVTTVYDKDADFGAFRTYSMPDSIVHICEDPTQENQDCPSELTRRYDADILSRVRQNLVDMGFRPATDPQQADVFVVVAANATDIQGYYYGWWYSWYYPGYPGYGWGYPYYPGYAVPYEYTIGTIFIGMIDPAKADNASRRLGAVWLAALNGLLGEGGSPQSRINTSVDQAFEQSPYLGTGK